MRRQIKKYGNTFVIKLEPKDLEDNEWQIGDWLDIEDIIKCKKQVYKHSKK